MTFCWGITSGAGRTISRKTEQDFWIWRIFHKCAAMRHQIAAPTFLLSCQKKSRRRSGGKEKRYQPNLHTVQVWENGFCENCCASEEISTKSRAECGFYPTLYAMLTVTSILGLQRGHPLLLFPLPLLPALRNPAALSKSESAESCAESSPIFRPNFQPHFQLRERTSIFKESLSAQMVGGFWIQ